MISCGDQCLSPQPHLDFSLLSGLSGGFWSYFFMVHVPPIIERGTQRIHDQAMQNHIISMFYHFPKQRCMRVPCFDQLSP